MDFKVIFKDTFVSDLELLVRTIAIENPSAAQRIADAIIKMGESLCFFPERFPKVRQRPGIRRYLVNKYFKIYYRINEETRTVEILRCWDGRRENDPPLR